MSATRLRADESIRLDGRLDHPAWQRAEEHDRFVEHEPPRPGEPVPQRTSVRVLFDERALYIGVIAFDDQPALMRDVPVRFDGVNRTQDFVVAYLDPIGQRRSAQFFRVNAAGSRADGIHTAVDDSEDFAPDFTWDAAVHRRDDGWSVVMRIPFASLRFAEADSGQPWRFMLARRLPRQHFHLLTSVAIPRSAPSFIDRLQPLQGIQLPARHAFWTLSPHLTLRQRRVTEGATSQRDDAQELGLDLKWRPRAELVIDGTWRPDFSQVALDVPQLSGNSRFALFLDEKRPFFFESADLLRTPTDAFYTRSITQPRGGLRATWRSTGLAATALAADDRGGGLVLLPGAYGTGAVDQPGSRVLAARLRAEGLGDGRGMLGGLLAARQYDDDRGDNVVAGVDGEWPLDGGWRLRAQWLGSHTTAQPDGGELRRAAAVSGQRAYAWAQRLDSTSETWIAVDDTADGFRHDTGFVNQAGVRTAQARHTWRLGRHGPFHQVDLYVEGKEVRARREAQRISSDLVVGTWAVGPHNFEGWVEWHALSRLRVSAASPLHQQQLLSTGLVATPARWFPLIESELTLGRLVDTVDDVVRPGARWRVAARLRPWRMLELEPSISQALLQERAGGGTRTVYRENAAQALLVWHLDGRQNLRLITQRGSLERKADGPRPALRTADRSDSLTYQWRQAGGATLYVGLSREHGQPAATGGREAFLKWEQTFGSGR